MSSAAADCFLHGREGNSRSEFLPVNHHLQIPEASWRTEVENSKESNNPLILPVAAEAARHRADVTSLMQQSGIIFNIVALSV